MNRFEDELRRAAGAGAPSTPAGLGARLVAGGRRRRQKRNWGAGIAAASVFVFGIAAMGELDRRGAAPIVTNPIDGAPSPAPSPSTSAEVGAQAQPDPDPTPTLPVALPTGDPSPEPSGSPAPSSSPSPRPSSSSSPRPGGAPPDDGTNDGATDIGITATTVTIATLVEETGATPEPRPDVRQAMEAFATYAAEDLGPIHGRTIEVMILDTRYDPNSARQVARESCYEAFAMIGSSLGIDQSQAVSQFTQTSRCPDLRADLVPVNGLGSYTWRVRQIDPELPGAGPWNAWQGRAPQAVASAAWIDEDAPSGATCTGALVGGAACTQRGSGEVHEDWIDAVQDLTSDRGWEWTYDLRHPKGDTSWYASAVQEMQDRDVEFVRMESSPVDTIRLAQKARERGWWPTFFTLDEKHYEPAVLASSGDSLDGAEIALDHLPWDDEGANPVLDRYVEWLERGDSGARPTSLGLYAWTAAEQLVESLRALGPAPTREALTDRWNDVEGWTAGGALAPRALTGSVGTDCSVVVRADSGEWVRGSGRPGTFTC